MACSPPAKFSNIVDLAKLILSALEQFVTLVCSEKSAMKFEMMNTVSLEQMCVFSAAKAF